VQDYAISKNYSALSNLIKLLDLSDEESQCNHIDLKKKTTTKRVSKSKALVRIVYEDLGLKVQKTSLEKLDFSQLELMKETLYSILDEVEKLQAKKNMS
jgi:hypothetical protein